MDMSSLRAENKRLAAELLKQSKLTIAKTGITTDFHQDLLNEVSFYKEQARNMGRDVGFLILFPQLPKIC